MIKGFRDISFGAAVYYEECVDLLTDKDDEFSTSGLIQLGYDFNLEKFVIVISDFSDDNFTVLDEKYLKCKEGEEIIEDAKQYLKEYRSITGY